MGTCSSKGDYKRTEKTQPRVVMHQSETVDNKNPICGFTSAVVASIKKSDEKSRVFRHQFWPHLLSKFHRYHISNSEMLELLAELKSLIKINYEFPDYSRAVMLCQWYGEKLQKLENDLYFKHKRAFEYFQFFGNPYACCQPNKKNLLFCYLGFDFSEEQIFKVAAKVRTFCQNDMDAFAFLSLYLQISVTNQLARNTIANTEMQYNNIIKKLELAYPANQSKSDYIHSEKRTQLADLQKRLQSGKSTQNVQKIVYNQETSHYDQLEKLILIKAQHAQKNQAEFTAFVKDIVYRKGYGFKTGVKIKSSNQKESLQRTIEKMYESQTYNSNGFLHAIIGLFPNSSSLKESQSREGHQFRTKLSDQVNEIMRKQMQEANEKIINFFQGQKETIFSAKDLLRGKCTFDKVEDIYEAGIICLERIQEAKSNDQSIYLVEVKDRLSKNTRDLVIIAKFNESIAEFQLALKLNSVSNEFNHKIYELKRSSLYSPITNLFILNKKWSGEFFSELMDLYQNIIKLDDNFRFDQSLTFKDLQYQIVGWKCNYLTHQQISLINTSNEGESEIKKKKEQILSFIDSKRSESIFNQSSHKYCEAKFWMANFDNDKAREVLKSLSSTELEESKEAMEIMADNFREQGQSQQALTIYEKLFALKKKNQQNQQCGHFAGLYGKLGYSYLLKGDYSRSLQNYNKCLQIRTRVIGAQSIDVAVTMNNIGAVYKQKGNYSKALQYYNKCLNIKSQAKGADSIDVAETLNNIGSVYKQKGNYNDALENYNKCLEIQTRVKGANSADVAVTLNNIGLVYKWKGDCNKALEYYNKCLEINTRIKGPESLDVAQNLQNIGNVYHSGADYTNALQYYNTCLQLYTKIAGPDSINVAGTYNNIGNVYLGQADYDIAEEYYHKSLDIETQVKGVESLDVAATLNNLGSFYNSKDDFDQALEHYNRSLEIKKKITGPDTLDVALTLNNLGLLYFSRQDYPKALEYYKQSLEIKTRIAGSDSNDVALTLNNIGLVYKEKRDYQKALEYFEKSLKIFNAINGEGCANSTAVSKNINDINELLILTAY